MAKILMKGTEAIAEAAIRAGCRFFFGYPITPQNQIPEYMSRRMPQVGGTFLQAESELAAINMVYGAGGCGKRAMTSSSSPGISLKQEGISYIAGARVPAVIVNIVRAGPGLGTIQPSQQDYMQATRSTGHGGCRTVVLGPASVQEAAELTMEAFEIADAYRIPVIIIGDGMIGQMMEPVDFDAIKIRKREIPNKDWAADISTWGKRPRAVINSLYIDPKVCEASNLSWDEMFKTVSRKEVRHEEYMTDDMDHLIVAFGTTSRICRNAIAAAREQGIRAGMIRPITLSPFPFEAIKLAADRVKSVLCVEMNSGQMVEDVRLAVNGKLDVKFFGRTGGMIPSPAEILQAVKDAGGCR
ncbi:MAG: 3-methyl-2-oxobutanoate dehydrogenase subunit VorB [Bacillota bacterium]|nr:3-methyl-2-oxobutanoate dehydrogenase subunit VorB [Bacillota bacterium]